MACYRNFYYFYRATYIRIKMEQILRERIEEMTGRKMAKPRDFAWLSRQIEERTRQRVSESTLRRFWGYVSEGVKASAYTKDVLAQFLGYRDFAQFSEMQGSGTAQSQVVLGDRICCDELYEGQQLRLSWLPDRVCVVRHEGNGLFTVVDSKNTRLAKGDTFECHLLIRHEPAYLDNWRHDGSLPAIYVIGKRDGVLVEKV